MQTNDDGWWLENAAAKFVSSKKDGTVVVTVDWITFGREAVAREEWPL